METEPCRHIGFAEAQGAEGFGLARRMAGSEDHLGLTALAVPGKRRQAHRFLAPKRREKRRLGSSHLV